MAMMAITTRSSINVNAAPLGDPRFCKRESARLLASFLFMAVGYINPGAAVCRWRAFPPNDCPQALRGAGAGPTEWREPQSPAGN